MKSLNISIIAILVLFLSACTKNTIEDLSSENSLKITSPGLYFTPDTLIINIGDTILFDLTATHNAVEVSEDTYINNGTISNEGFNIGYGESKLFIADEQRVYYYVCQPHVTMGMKAIIIVL